MGELITTIMQNADKSATTVFLGLFLLILFMLRKDHLSHKEDWKDMINRMFDVVNKNTESNTKLSDSISDLKDRIR